MAKWKCKYCGCESFTEHYMNGYRKYGEYDEEGEPIYETLEDDDPELEIECEKCGNRGLYLKNIAELVE
jgi:predicted nucleic-acid-binding Zn-ribbon protein